MIVCTKSADAVTRRAFGRDKVLVSDINTIITNLPLDASISNPAKEAFIVSETDFGKPKIKQEFMEAAGHKHPTVKLIVMARAKTALAQGNGIDRVLVNPKPEQLAEVMEDLLESIASKPVGSAFEAVDKFVPKEFVKPKGEESARQAAAETSASKEQVFSEDMIEAALSESVKELSEDEVVTNEQAEDAMLKRIKDCNTIADVSLLAREVTAVQIVKEMLNENNEYSAIEEKLKGLQQKVYSVMVDPLIPTLDEKWSKVRALIYDKSYYAVRGTTILEQRIELLIKTLSEKTQELLREKMAEVDKVIIHYKNLQPKEFVEFSRLSSVLDTRAKMILDLACLEKELGVIFKSTDKLAADASEKIIMANTSATGIPVVDNQLKVRGESVTTQEGLEVITRMLNAAVSNSKAFEDYKEQLELMNRKVAELLKVDNDLIKIQSDLIAYLASKKVEDTVIANSLIKKAMRVYTGTEGTGRSVIPYVVSAFRARTPMNVLLVDLTGTSKLKDYGVGGVDLFDWLGELYEKQLCVVTGSIDGIEDAASVVQRISNALVRAADYYRMINIVIRPDQQELFDILAPDALSVNFITDLNTRNLEATRKMIEDMVSPNVAQKVFVNKCNACTESIVEKLGLAERINVGYVRVPYISQIVDCALDGVDPSKVDVVDEMFAEVMLNA